MLKRKPLYLQLRPKTLQEFIGQEHLLGDACPLRAMINNGQLASMILWGPPGTGKTTIVKLLAKEVNASFHSLDATDSTVKDIRNIVKLANVQDKQLVLFIDEMHRFNKAQQDVLLPIVEEGIITLVGVTTEKPKFAINSTLLSRCLVYEMMPYGTSDMLKILSNALQFLKADSNKHIELNSDSIKLLINRCSGDARKLITILELASAFPTTSITPEVIYKLIPDKHLSFSANGSEHFDLASCYQDAIQNSDPDGAIYWLAKWIESGEDPAYICRRMIISAYEDCASRPDIMSAAVGACLVTERTGLPECQIAMATVTILMATCKRDKTGYYAIKMAMHDVKNNETVHVPDAMRAGEPGYIRLAPRKYINDKWPS